MKVIWYWPCLRVGMQTGLASNIAQYGNCMAAQWKPSYERHNWVMKEATIFSWEDVPRRSRATVLHGNEVQVHDVITKAEI